LVNSRSCPARKLNRDWCRKRTCGHVDQIFDGALDIKALTRTAPTFPLSVNLGKSVDYLRHGYEKALSHDNFGNVPELFAEQRVDPAQPKIGGHLRKLDQIKFRTSLYLAQEPNPPAFTWPSFRRPNSNCKRLNHRSSQGSDFRKPSTYFEVVQKFQTARISVLHPTNDNGGDQGFLAGEVVLECRRILLAGFSGNLPHRNGINTAFRIQALCRAEQRLFRRIPAIGR
jgi:hypothetical protein